MVMELQLHFSANLTPYVIKILKAHNVLTTTHFVKQSNERLSQITNLEVAVITDIKNDMRRHFKPYEITFKNGVIATDIEKLDTLLGGGLTTGQIYDICGLSATGKTQICSTIAVNLAEKYNLESLFIDSKKDFSGSRISKILTARNSKEKEAVMQRIRVERVNDVDAFLKILRELPSYLANNRRAKCLVVDSLPALWFQLLDGKTNGVSYLCEATNLMRKMAYLNDMVFVLVNIVTRTTVSVQDVVHKSQQTKTITSVALGKYWQTVPRQRFLMSRVEGAAAEYISYRTIKIIHGSGQGRTCTINITNKGVV